MARYEEIADDLQKRIEGGEFEVGSRLPSISALQKVYEVDGLNTIRSAEQLLVEKGLLRTQQGVGAFVIATRVPEQLDVLTELEAARDTLTRVIATLRAQSAAHR